jgi:hypothetical protein
MELQYWSDLRYLRLEMIAPENGDRLNSNSADGKEPS